MITSLSIGTGGLGRFGNQAFTIASCIGIARNSGQPFAFPRWKNHDNALFGGRVDGIQENLVNPLPELTDDFIVFQPYGYFWGHRDIKLPTGNWTIDAHMQSEKFFKHCINEIRHYFTIKDEPEQNDYVAIHYRAGDYIDDPSAYHPRQTLDYYTRAIEQFPDEQFLIFSDDYSAAVDMMKKTGRTFDIAGGSYLCDFKEMKKCKSFITANSSFSMMAAILGDHPEKKIVAPKKWFGPHVGLETQDLYPENSIIL